MPCSVFGNTAVAIGRVGLPYSQDWIFLWIVGLMLAFSVSDGQHTVRRLIKDWLPVIVALLAAVVGAGLSRLLGPLFPMQVIVPAVAFIALPVIAVVIGLIASATGLRRAVSVDPALAFGGP